MHALRGGMVLWDSYPIAADGSSVSLLKYWLLSLQPSERERGTAGLMSGDDCRGEGDYRERYLT